MRNNLIIMLKWVMNKFSKTIDENAFDVRQYIFRFSEAGEQVENGENLDAALQKKQVEFNESIERRKKRDTHF